MQQQASLIFGVCWWLSQRFSVDVFGLRIAFIVLTVLGVGSPVLIYLLLALLKPKYS
jgi:phage shock protein C